MLLRRAKRPWGRGLYSGICLAGFTLAGKKPLNRPPVALRVDSRQVVVGAALDTHKLLCAFHTVEQLLPHRERQGSVVGTVYNQYRTRNVGDLGRVVKDTPGEGGQHSQPLRFEMVAGVCQRSYQNQAGQIPMLRVVHGNSRTYGAAEQDDMRKGEPQAVGSIADRSPSILVDAFLGGFPLTLPISPIADPEHVAAELLQMQKNVYPVGKVTCIPVEVNYQLGRSRVGDVVGLKPDVIGRSDEHLLDRLRQRGGARRGVREESHAVDNPVTVHSQYNPDDHGESERRRCGSHPRPRSQTFSSKNGHTGKYCISAGAVPAHSPSQRQYIGLVATSTKFTDSEIEQHAFPAIIRAGRALVDRGAVKDIQFYGKDIVASVRAGCRHTAVIARRVPLQYTCTCGYAYGGACEHVIAAMLAVNARDAVQIGLELDTGVQSDKQDTPARDDVPQSELASEIEDLAPPPVARLYLNEYGGLLVLELRFAYGGLAEFARREPDKQRLITRGDGTFCRVHRSRARESMFAARLADFDLVPYSSGSYTPRCTPQLWVQNRLPELVEEGFEVYGRENLQSCQVREDKPSLGLSVRFEGDQVLCEPDVSFDGIAAPLQSVFDAAIKGERYVKLADGSTGVLPQEWLERFVELFALSERRPEGSTLTVSEHQIQVLDRLDSIATASNWDERAREVRRSLATFDGVPHVKTPSQFRGQLRSYQQAGYEWLCFLQQARLGGVLADDMGLGKTIQTLALLQHQKERRVRPRTSLLVVPTSLLFNWTREAQRFAPKLLVMQYHGPQRKKYGAEDMRLADLIITTYGTVQRDLDTLLRLGFNYVILDESQAIKNPLSATSESVRTLRARNHLALSGTPLENNLSELWSLFAFVNPGMLGPYRRFLEHYAKPIERDRNSPRAETLKRLIAPCILRRTKEQVAKDLPPKSENVLYCTMTPSQQTFYEITRDAYRSRIMQSIDEVGMEQSRMQILEGLLRLRQICCHPALVDPKFGGDSGKFSLMDSSLEEIIGGGHKVLIFSQFVSALQIVAKRLERKEIRYQVLTGKTRDRGKAVDDFQTSRDVAVMLISLKAGGTGLNLTAADYVIHLDPWWNPAVENQASARAHRIGQTRNVFVYKMITQDSVEERVLQLQQSKRELFDMIIDTESSVFKTLTRGDIEDLFSGAHAHSGSG